MYNTSESDGDGCGDRRELAHDDLESSTAKLVGKPSTPAKKLIQHQKQANRVTRETEERTRDGGGGRKDKEGRQEGVQSGAEKETERVGWRAKAQPGESGGGHSERETH